MEINSSAITNNIRSLKSQLKQGCLFMAVVKADGYGHGAETVARASLEGGADSLGVATLQEGIELRKFGFKCPILVLGNLINHNDLQNCLNWQLMPTLSTLRQAIICQNLSASKASNHKFKFHFKI